MLSLVNSINVEILEDVAEYAIDSALTEGVLFRCAQSPKSSSTSVQFAPFSLFPSPIPHDLYKQAVTVQRDFNVLINAVSKDEEFLHETLKDTVAVDNFTYRLYGIFRAAGGQRASQKAALGIHRSDYMIDVSTASPSLKQIEINTIASSFGGLSSRLANVHKRVLARCNQVHGTHYEVSKVPSNDVPGELAEGYISAHSLYKDHRSSEGQVTPAKCAILFVIDEGRNTFDQRLLEIAIQDHSNGQVPVLRKTLKQVHEQGRLDEETNLLYLGNFEVSVAYFRVGYDPSDYPSDLEWEARLKIEKSRAVKCPSIAYHLLTAKKFQQALAAPGVLERFLDDAEAVKRVRSTFVGLYGLDDSVAGNEAIMNARRRPDQFVLKPQREGGANNFYGSEILTMLDKICSEDNGKERAAFILMDRISPMPHQNIQLRPGQEKVDLKVEEMASELGIFGVFLTTGSEVLMNKTGGHLLRTKQSYKDEGGVCAGFAGIDSPYFV